MKLLFCALYERNHGEVLKNSKVKPNFAISNYNEKLIRGFTENLGENFEVISTRTVAAYPKYSKLINSKKEYRVGGCKCTEVYFINLPLIKYFFEYWSIYKELKKWCEKYKEELYVCSYGRRISHALAINRIKRKYKNIKTCMIYGDLSGKLATKTTKVNPIKEFVVDHFLNYSIKQSLKMDCAVFFTKFMSEALKNKKPYIIVEGVCDEQTLMENWEDNKQKHEKIIVVYTGILSRKYALDTLIDSFQCLDEEKYELHLYGIGEMVDELKELRISNVFYKGYIEPSKISGIQKEADILINPRQNTEIYTKYSFPSKTMEYLSTGNPVICYKLDGIPAEYDDYLFYVKDNTSKAIAEKICEISNLSREQKEIHKEKTLKFLQDNKTAKKQCKMILDFLRFDGENVRKV